jgi:uncharacterized protein YraI
MLSKLIAGLTLAATCALPGMARAGTVQVTAAHDAHVRSGPGLYYEVVGELTAGETAPATGRSGSAGNWLRIDYNESAGWVAHYAVTVQGDPRLLSRAEPDEPQTPPRRETGVMVHVFRTVNVRSGPGIESEIVTRLRSGDVLRAIGRSDEGSNWLQLDLEGAPGWVAYFTVTVTGRADTLPVVVPELTLAPRRTPAPDAAVTVQAFRVVNVRSGPDTALPALGQLLSGDVAAATGRSDSDNNWLRITFDQADGWVAYFTVSVSGDPGTLPLVEARTG